MNKKDYEDFIDKILMPQLTREIATKLQYSQKELILCKWTDGESNTDTDFSKLAGKKADNAFHEIINLYPSFQNKITIQIKSPDLKISFNIIDNNSVIKRKIELKSGYAENGNDVIIPGSTIGKLDINIWVIFILRKNNNQIFDVRYGRYYKGIKITQNELFQDRTPRPKLAWSSFQSIEENPDDKIIEKDKEWIKKYAKAAVNRIITDTNNSSWQDDLVIEIIKYIFNNQDILEDVIVKLSIDKNSLLEKINNIKINENKNGIK